MARTSWLQRLAGSFPQAGSTAIPQFGEVTAATYANDNSVGTAIWSLYGSNIGGFQATGMGPGERSYNLVGNFPASPIPASATIVGLTLTITGMLNPGASATTEPPVLGGLGASASPPGQAMTPSGINTSMIFGSATSLAPWGLAGLTAATWNAATITARTSVLNTGSNVANTVELINYILTVYYTLPGIAGTVVDVITNGAGRSLGAQSVLPLAAQPTITSPWTILGWSITFQMQLWAATAGAVNGLLGRLYGGLILGGAVTPQSDLPFMADSLPSDPATIAELWDGSSDATPPWSSGIPNFTVSQNVDTVSAQLPSPLVMAPADKLGVGLWLTPSLGAPVADGGAVWLAVAAQFAIEYTTG